MGNGASKNQTKTSINQSFQINVTLPIHYFVPEFNKDLESLEEIIFDLDENNITESVNSSINLLAFGDISSYSNSILIKLVCSAILSQMKDLSIYLNYMKQIETKGNCYELITTFIDFFLNFDSYESNFILERMIDMNLISSESVKDKHLFYFVHHFPNSSINLYNPFDGNYEEFLNNDFALHKQYVKEGHNPNELAKIIRNDEIEKLQEISSQTNFDFNQTIKPSLYERYSFINHKNVTLIDYAAFFSSVKCFKYFLMNGSKLDKTGKYAVAGGNEEIIHLCEQNHSSFEGAYEAAIKFHRNDIFKYLYENNVINFSANTIIMSCLSDKFINHKIFNFLFVQEGFDINAKDIYLFYLKYFFNNFIFQNNIRKLFKLFYTALMKASLFGHTEIVKLLLEQKGIDINAKDIYLFYFGFILIILLYIKIIFGNYSNYLIQH